MRKRKTKDAKELAKVNEENTRRMKKHSIPSLDAKVEESVALNGKQKKFVKAVLDGKTQVEAAVEAGYGRTSRRAAKQVGYELMHSPKIIAAIQVAIRDAGVSPELLAKRIREGLDATKTTYFQKDGQVTDSRDSVDYAERREMVKTVTNILTGNDKEAKGDGGGKDGKINVSVVLNAVRNERGL